MTLRCRKCREGVGWKVFNNSMICMGSVQVSMGSDGNRFIAETKKGSRDEKKSRDENIVDGTHGNYFIAEIWWKPFHMYVAETKSEVMEIIPSPGRTYN